MVAESAYHGPDYGSDESILNHGETEAGGCACNCIGNDYCQDSMWGWLTGTDQKLVQRKKTKKTKERRFTKPGDVCPFTTEAFVAFADDDESDDPHIPASDLGELLFMVTRRSYPPRVYNRYALEINPAYKQTGLTHDMCQTLMRRLEEDLVLDEEDTSAFL